MLPTDVKHVENINVNAEVTDDSRYVSIIALLYISLDVICFQITAFSGNVLFRKIIFSNVGGLINLQGVTESRRDRCMLSTRQHISDKLFYYSFYCFYSSFGNNIQCILSYSS